MVSPSKFIKDTTVTNIVFFFRDRNIYREREGESERKKDILTSSKAKIGPWDNWFTTKMGIYSFIECSLSLSWVHIESFTNECCNWECTLRLCEKFVQGLGLVKDATYHNNYTLPYHNSMVLRIKLNLMYNTPSCIYKDI